MRLTTLDVKGFKSFADRTTIHFNENITGVVGPNGSGKSNVVDAIRWVLGEQRTSNLRSEKMDNLIFNGSKGRKPAGLAEVSLSFDNTKNILPTDFKQITITRRLYRSGDSEYRINDVPCRLKDITNLFLDTGISSDSYAIIELKMIDEILHDRDNSRRKLFEQAAGISKYKKRKKETLSKLTSTDNDLARVEDLLFEIEGNLKTLESQARKAKKYQTLKEQYKQLSLDLAKFQMSKYVSAFKALKKQQTDQEEQKMGFNARLDKLEAQVEKEKVAIIEKEKHLSDRQKQLNELIAAINKKENERNVTREQIKFLEEKKSNLHNQIDSAESQQKALAEKAKDLEANAASQQKIVELAKTELEALGQLLSETRIKHSATKTTLDEQRTKRSQLDQEIHELEKQAAINRSERESLFRTIEQTRQENEDRNKELNRLGDDLKGFEERYQEKQGVVDKLELEEEKLNEQIIETQRFIEETRQKQAQENRSLDFKQNEYDLNKNLVDNLEGFPESIKFLKKKEGPLANTPLLSDIIYCKEDYRRLIENFLEPYLNYFIVNDSKDATQAIDKLHDSSKGRAHFFLLSEFAHYEPSQTIISANVTHATEVVEVDKAYQKLAAFLLDNVYIVKDADFLEGDILAELSPKKDQMVTILSSSGKYIRSNFALSGGAVGLFEGMRLGRKKNLEKLAEDIQKLEAQTSETSKLLNNQETNLAKLKKSSQLQEIQHAKHEANQISNHVASLRAKIENFESFVKESQNKASNIESRIEGLDKHTGSFEGKLKELLTHKTDNDLAVAQLDQDFQEISDQLSAQSATYNEKNIQFHQQQNLLNTFEQERKFVTTQSEDLKNRSEKNKLEIENAITVSKLQQASLEQLEKELLADIDEKEKFEQSLTHAETEYYKARGSINELEEQLKKEQKAKGDVEYITNQIKDKLTDLKIELNSLKERLSVEFNIDINNIINDEPGEELDEEEIAEKVQKIRARIENYGDINPMAVEAYDEMKERHTFITDQKEDLEKAKASLLETMDEIETTAKEKFLEAFDKVRDNFKIVFRSLFTEDDDCDLILTTPNNPLEASIDIIAKPKGKRPQVIDQLSGGEKTLTALSILFSLYLLKAAPFCILDEVDAPLDDTNIGKFNKAIRQFSKESQFIMVTHNKQTMASVDVIYGVTMQEMGVSKVVPVDFRDKKDTYAEAAIAAG